MHVVSNLRIKKLYGSAATQNQIFADLEDAYLGYSIKGVRIIDLKHNYDKIIQESENDAIFSINHYCLKDTIVLLSRFDSRQPCERMAVILDAQNFSTSNRLLGGASASGKDSAHILQQQSLKSEHQSLSNDPTLVNLLQSQYQNSTQTQWETQNDKTQSQNETNNAEIHKPVIKILVQELGSGNFGTVVEVLDLMNNTTKIEKTLRQKKDYEKEKQTYQNLEVAYTQEKQQLLKDLSILPDHFEDERSTIHFAAGQTSLYTLKQAKYFEFTDQQLVHIFSRLLDFILLLGEQKYCHSDIKPENVTLVQVQGDNRYLAKIIDLSQLSRDELGQNKFTPNYFLNPMREYDSQNRPIFKNIEDRLKNEFFTIVRTMQRLMIKENIVSEDFTIKVDLMASNRQQYLDKMKDFWSKADLLSNRRSEELQKIISFISNSVFSNNENYQINDLQELSNQLKSIQNYQELYGNFVDSNGTVSTIIKTKQQEAVGIESAMSQLFELESFFYEKGSRKDDYSDDFELLSEVKNHLLKNSEQVNKKPNLVLFGESGTDNSLFVSKLMQDILKDSKFSNHLIIFFKLRDLSGEKSTKKQLSKLQEHLKQETARYLQKDKPILLFLGGFDELNNKKIKIDKALNNTIFGNKLIIVVTSRPRYALYSDFLKCFGEHEVINICPFNKQQRDEYINQSIAFLKRLKSKIIDFEIFDTVQEYIEVLEQQQNLKELAQVSFTLSLILAILPKIKTELKKNNQLSQGLVTQKLSKYQIYQIFEQQFTEREFKRVMMINEYKDVIHDHYEAPKMPKIKDNEDVMGQIKHDLKLFHQFCSWKMLQKQQLKLTWDDIEEIVQEILQINGKNYSDIAHIFIKIAPVQTSSENDLSYIHKSVYEFFIAQSVIEETLQQSKLQILEIKTTKLSQGFLAFDLDILCMLAEHLSELKLDEQYLYYCETWYRSLLLTRRIKQNNITDEKEILKLERMGSNCINLIAALPWIDLTERDFSDCAMPHAYLYKRDLTGSNNLRL